MSATTHGQRDLGDDRLSNLIKAISNKRLGLKDVEADIIAKVLQPEPGMEIHDPCRGSGGLLVKCEIALAAELASGVSKSGAKPAHHY